MKQQQDSISLVQQSADQVVRHVAILIERGALRPGDRLAPERELAQELGVSRPTVRAGLHALAAAAGNPVLLALVEMVSSLVYQQRKETVERAHDLKESAEMHRRIYQAI